jgi:hypothetical protein
MMKLIILAGIKENPIAITNTIKVPFLAASLSLNFAVTGKGELTTLNLKFLFPVAAFRMAS